MKYQIKYFVINNKEKKLIKKVPINLSLDNFGDEIYDSGYNKISINGKATMSGVYLNPETMIGSFSMKSDIIKRKTIFMAIFDLNYFNKTCFTFLFYDDVFISVDIERILSE